MVISDMLYNLQYYNLNTLGRKGVGVGEGVLSYACQSLL